MPLLRPIIGIVFFFGLFMMVMLGLAVGLPGFSAPQGETIPGSQTAGDTGPAVDAGPISDDVPASLANLFRETGGTIGVPAALLAAISNQECNRVWAISSSQLEPFILNNTDFPLRKTAARTDLGHMGCAYDNGSNVWGPMQFQYMTFFGYPKGRRFNWNWEGQRYTDIWAQSFITANPRNHPVSHPTPLAGTPGGQASTFTAKNPASILSLKDSVYAAAIKLKADAGRNRKPKSTDWARSEIGQAACTYYGSCSFDGVNYHSDVTKKYDKYRSKLDN